MPTVAILGASADRSKFGNKSVRAHQQQGFTVYPVNPKADVIEGLAAYKSLADVPAGKLDRISVYLPPPVGMALLPEIAARGCDELWLNPGSDSDELVAAAREKGLNVIQACSIVDVGVSPHDLH
jgi:predicted CoA-binding protein